MVLSNNGTEICITLKSLIQTSTRSHHLAKFLPPKLIKVRYIFLCFSDELDPIQAMAFEDHAYEDNWEKAGFEEGFEVEWTQANYELPHVSGVHTDTRDLLWM